MKRWEGARDRQFLIPETVIVASVYPAHSNRQRVENWIYHWMKSTVALSSPSTVPVHDIKVTLFLGGVLCAVLVCIAGCDQRRWWEMWCAVLASSDHAVMVETGKGERLLGLSHVV